MVRLAADATYLFEVAAVNTFYGAGPSASVQATLPALPEAPASLTASSVGPSIALAWPDPEDPSITGWQYRHRFPGNADFGPWADMPGAGAGTTSHLLRGLRPATVYVFQVRAVNAGGAGGPSPEARATPFFPPVPFNVEVEVLDAAPGVTPKVRVRWRVNSTPPDTTWQMRHNGEYPGLLDWIDVAAPAVDSAGRLSATPRTFENHGGVEGHWWQVRAISAGVPGAVSPVAFVPYLNQSVSASSGLAPGAVRLTSSQITNAAKGDIQYRYRLGDGAWGAWTDGGALDAMSRKVDIDIEGLRTDAGPYSFQVRKVRAGNADHYAFPAGGQLSPLLGYSKHSQIIKATPLGVPPAPTGFRLSATRIPTGFRLAPFWDDLTPDVASRFKWELRHKVGSGSFSNWIGDADLTSTVTRDVEVAGDARVVFELRYLNDVSVRPAFDTDAERGKRTVKATFDPPPAAPTGLTAAPGNGEIRLVWDDPGDSGILRWQVRWKRTAAGSFGAWSDVPGSDAGTTEHSVGGLVNGVGYDLQLRAVNANAEFSEGPASGTVSATPLAVPETPVGFAATAGDGTVALRWSSAGDASITAWQTRVRVAGGVFGSWVDVLGATAGTTQWRMAGLTNGTTFEFQLRAVNPTGAGLPSATVTATPRAPLAAPAGLRATPASGEVTLNWNFSGNVSRFETRWRSSGSWSRWITVPRSARKHTVTGLANGIAYRLELRAVNQNGPGPAAGVSATPVANIPARTTGLTALSGDGEIILSWRSPRDPAITRWEFRHQVWTPDHYTHQFIQGPWTPWTAMPGASAATRSWRVTGLTNGTIYSIEVRAVGAGGAGLPSDGVLETPHPLPEAPNLSASNRDIGAGAIELKISEPRHTDRIAYWQIRLRRDDAEHFGPWLRVPPPASGQGSSYHVLRGLPGGVEHVVEARGVMKDSGNLGPAKQVRASALHPLDPPGNPAARADGDAVVLSWDGPPDDPGGALNWGARWKADGGPWGAWREIDGGTDVVRESGRLTWRIEGLALDRTWTFELRADRSGGNKLRPDHHNVVRNHPGDFAVSTELAPVATRSGPGLLAVAEGSEVVLTWPDPGDAGFRWELRSGGKGSWGAWRSVGVSSGTDGAGAAVLTHRVRGLSSWETHEFQIRSVSGRSASAPSPTAAVVPVAVPAAPTGLSAAVAGADVVLRWNNPGDPSIRSWQVRSRTAAATWPGWTNAATTTPSDAPDMLAHTVEGLEAGRTWYFQARAVSVSAGAVSKVVSVNLPTQPRPGDMRPAQPTGEVAALTAGEDGSAELLLSWDPLTDPTIGSWEYEAGAAVSNAPPRVANEQFATGSYTTSASLAWSFSGAVEQLRIRAVNSEGAGPWSEGVLVAALPPPSLSVVALDSAAFLSWRFPQPESGGSFDVEGWEVRVATATEAGTWRNIPGGSGIRSHRVVGLANATPYTVELRALKGDAAGVAAPVTVTPTGVRPAAPAMVEAVAGDDAVALRWDDPGDDSITAWQFRQRVGNRWGVWRTIADSDADTTEHRVEGLDNGVEYGFRVRALNAFGNGAESVEVTATPEGAPDAPRPGQGARRRQAGDPDLARPAGRPDHRMAGPPAGGWRRLGTMDGDHGRRRLDRSLRGGRPGERHQIRFRTPRPQRGPWRGRRFRAGHGDAACGRRSRRPVGVDGERRRRTGDPDVERSAKRLDHRLAVPPADRQRRLGRVDGHPGERRLDHPP